ncbi:EamA family transporter [Roseovarius arcticus]|uniref:EamA family transporter n=1 Tax=Roseovarius arcticus TaxID=2547404 RepID=UPI00319E4A3D
MRASSAAHKLVLYRSPKLWRKCYSGHLFSAIDCRDCAGTTPHFATLRAVISGLVLVALACLLNRPVPRGIGAWASLSVMGVGASSFGFMGMFHAAEFVSPGIATVIANTQPLIGSRPRRHRTGRAFTTRRESRTFHRVSRHRGDRCSAGVCR